jgi:hypothetical protein
MEQNDIETICENIRENCVLLSKAHKKRYIQLKELLKYFRIPVILLSGLNSVMSVGLQPFVVQEYISVGTCLVSLCCGIIGSIELYLSISSQMENALITSKAFYLLGTDIYKFLSLSPENRNEDSKLFLEEKFSHYQKLIENSNVIQKSVTDKLMPLPDGAMKLQMSVSTSQANTNESSSISSNDEIV